MPASIDSRRLSIVVECVSATLPRRCASSTITFCASGENPISAGRAKCALPPYLMKSGPLSRYARIADAQLFGLHVDEILAGSLGDFVVDLLLEQRQALLANQAEADRVGPAPPDDVAGGQDAGTDRVAAA